MPAIQITLLTASPTLNSIQAGAAHAAPVLSTTEALEGDSDDLAVTSAGMKAQDGSPTHQ